MDECITRMLSITSIITSIIISIDSSHPLHMVSLWSKSVSHQSASCTFFMPSHTHTRRNATVRSKAESRTRTFLWMYCHKAQEMGACRAAFQKAVEMYQASNPVEPLETFQVRLQRRLLRASLYTQSPRQRFLCVSFVTQCNDSLHCKSKGRYGESTSKDLPHS
jgi:hypothetical protein